MSSEQIQEPGLRDLESERVFDTQLPGDWFGNRAVGIVHRKIGDALGCDGQDAVEQVNLVEHLQSRRMDSVAPEVAIEVGVGFEQADLDALARQQQAEHDASRPTAHDTAVDAP